MSRFARLVRVEDLLAAAFALALVIYGGLRAVLGGVRLEESDYWDFSFILSPLSVLVFLSAVRYAVGGGRSLLAATARRVLSLFRDWLPFLLFLLFYEAFRTRVWMVLLGEDRDRELLLWDRRLFGETPAVWMDRLVLPALTDLMSIAYFLHLVLPPLVASFLWYRKSRDAFREFLLAVLLAGIMGSIGYMMVPAVGPALAYPELFQRPLEGIFHDPIAGVMDAARAPRDVFPSLHVGVSTIVLWYGLKLGRSWGWILAPLVAANWLSTIYLRYHYLVDVFAGWLVAAAAIWAAHELLGLERRLKEAR